MEKSCKACGETFEPAHHSQTFCRRADCREQHPKSYRLKVKHPPRACKWCGGPIPDERKAGVKYCSNACNNAACKARDPEGHAARIKAWKAAHRTQFPKKRCDGCGVEFQPRRTPQRFHSGACRVAYLERQKCDNAERSSQARRKKLEDRRKKLEQEAKRACEGCGVEFQALSTNQRYHSAGCRAACNLERERRRSRERARARYHADPESGREKRRRWREENHEADLAGKLEWSRAKARSKMEMEFLALSAVLQEKLKCQG